MTAGTILRHCREKAGISQVKLARLLNRTQSSISKLEKDQNPVDTDTFRDWTRITNQMEAGIAFLYGVDPASVIQTILQVSGAA
ncbi:helix-turn-helix domain-containing protein [Paenibacillus sinopodophylli]|uniref:helix-turn-helix domain-containing protein n=1 Tax=Paenibacillus sinopodophylli TaxID=1837342 RepID=UPI00110CC93D|nr:helix-turn-helix transcriptional regulator [Paenibacillus sinopodophylli]